MAYLIDADSEQLYFLVTLQQGYIVSYLFDLEEEVCLISQTFASLWKINRKKMTFYFIVAQKNPEASCFLPWNVNKSTVVTIIQPFPGWKEQKRMFCLLARTMVRHFICQIYLYVQCFQKHGICVLKCGKFDLTTLQIKNYENRKHISEYMCRFQKKEEHQRC